MSYEAWGDGDDGPDWRDDAIKHGWIDPVDVGRAMTDVIRERDRQVNEEGFSSENDDAYQAGQLERGAAAYALYSCQKSHWFISGIWALPSKWFKPRSHRENLVRAAALLIAAIEKIDRAAKRAQSEEQKP